jgi:plasmid stabilization system protein ParE
MGTARPDLDETIRTFAHKSYVVLYELLRDGIQVLGVYHGAQDLDQLFGD